MHIHFDRIGCHRLSRGRDVGNAVRQASGRWQRIGRVADGIVGDPAARVPIPRAGAHVATRRNVHQLVVGGAVGKRAGVGRVALAGKGRRRTHLARLPVGNGDARGRRLQRERVHIGDLHPVAQSIAVVRARVAGAAGDRNPGRNGKAQQTNKRQEPPHESSPPRFVEPQNGHSRINRKIWVKANFPLAAAGVCRWHVALSSGVPGDRSWSLGWKQKPFCAASKRRQ